MDSPSALPLDQLSPHPDNPRLQLREDVVARLAAEIERNGYGSEHAVLVRPHGAGWQLVSGHHRAEAARRAGLTEIPAWVRQMDDDEAFMQLVLGNTQGELAALEFGLHALGAKRWHSASLSMKSYAERVGLSPQYLSEMRKAAEVATVMIENTTLERSVFDLVEKAKHLYEISKAPRPLWPMLVGLMLDRGWTVADTQHYVSTVREFDIPERWSWWLPLSAVVERFLLTREFSPATVTKMVKAADQVVEWIDANAHEPDGAHGEFRAWLIDKGPDAWAPREIAGYLARLIASQFVVEGWHQGDWREHVGKLDDGTVALLLTDPPYGMGYQSDYRLDRRKERKHKTIAADASDADAAFMRDSQVPIALSAFETRLENAAWRSRPSWAVIATDDKAFDQRMLRAMAERIGAAITEVKASHAVFMTQSKVVADTIDEAARSAAAATR